MAAFLPDPWIVDAIIALVAIEGVVLVLWRALTGGGLPIAETLANLSSGAALLLALRMALTGASPAYVLAVLSVALIAHLADLASRWETGGRLPKALLHHCRIRSGFRGSSKRRKLWRARWSRTVSDAVTPKTGRPSQAVGVGILIARERDGHEILD